MQIRTLGAALLAAVSVAACKTSDLNITNPNAATVEGAQADPGALQLQATGLLADYRGLVTGFPSGVGILGRESYTFTPTEGRNTTAWLIGIVVGGQQKLDPAGFATGNWSPGYNTMRDVFNFKKAVEGSLTLTTAQKAAALGFAQTFEGIALLQVISTRDTLGAIVEIRENATDLAPFVTRDSVYKVVLATLDAGATNLQAGGTAFPFNLHSGFAGFNTPATFLQFNRAMKARASAYYATAGGGTTAWQAALTALAGSFLNASATTRAQLDAGIYQIFSTATGDATNGFSSATNTTQYAHMSIQADAQLKLDGTRDNRYLAKIRTGLPSRSGLTNGDGAVSASSTIGFSAYPSSTTPFPAIRNEELILLRAEARLATGDKAGAIADLNQVRVNSGGLPPSTLTALSSNDAIIDGILYEKRYSLLLEGHRWIDHRRYGRLAQLPLDIATGPNKNFVAKVMPIPQGDCLVRATGTGDILGPTGQNNCAPLGAAGSAVSGGAGAVGSAPAPPHIQGVNISRIAFVPALAVAALVVGSRTAAGQGAVRVGVGAATDTTRQTRRASGTIEGLVADSALAPLAGAQITILSSNVRVGTGPNGRFRITDVPAGQYVLIVRRGGFQPTSNIVQVAAGDTLRLDYTLERGITSLAPAVIEEARVSLRMSEFEMRRKSGFGEFMTAADIEKRNTVYTTELMRRFTSVNVGPSYGSGGGGMAEYFALSKREGGSLSVAACPFTVIVDEMAMPTPFNLDLLPSPKWIAGIEVYGGAATIPPRYSGMNRGCGVILIWTKDGY